MRNMKCENRGCYGLSKGTQSDGLISDTSTEELTSSSSTENFKEGQICEKVSGNKSKKVNDEFQNSKILINSKSPTSLHLIQTRCQLYIRWGVLLSFGILLWIALWITDIFNPNPFLKEGWLIDVATAKKVTLRAGNVKKAALSTWWFFNLWSYAWNSIISISNLEILMFLCCTMILVYLKTHTKYKWEGTTERLCFAQFLKSLLDNGAGQSETDNENSSFHFDILEEELASKELQIKSYGDDLSKFSHGDVRNSMVQDEIEVKSKLGEKSTQCLNQNEILSIENRISKSLRDSRNLNNKLKRSLQSNGGKSYYNYSRRSNNLSQDVVASEMIFNKPNFNFNRITSMSERDGTESIPEQSNLTCSIFNKSTSFISEKFETWFELPNSNQAEKVMHSFDTELEEFFKIRSSPLPTSFKETTRDVQRFNDSNVSCECDEESKTVTSDVDHNPGIVSSSPAFRRFLVNLAKDRLSKPYS